LKIEKITEITFAALIVEKKYFISKGRVDFEFFSRSRKRSRNLAKYDDESEKGTGNNK